jgi:hypothetical protein
MIFSLPPPWRPPCARAPGGDRLVARLLLGLLEGLKLTLGSDCKFGCRAIALHSVCSDSKKKWVYWWASNYASPGLTVLRRRSPGPPAPAQAGTRGAINYFGKRKWRCKRNRQRHTALDLPAVHRSHVQPFKETGMYSVTDRPRPVRAVGEPMPSADSAG